MINALPPNSFFWCAIRTIYAMRSFISFFSVCVFISLIIHTIETHYLRTFDSIFAINASHYSSLPFSVGWSARKHTSAKIFIFFVERSLQSSDGNSTFGLSLYLQISHSFLAHIDKRIKASRTCSCVYFISPHLPFSYH